MLQEPVHVDDGEQRTDDTALWRATLVALATAHCARIPVATFPLLRPVLAA